MEKTMTANHAGRTEPRNRILTICLLLCAAVAHSAPPYDVTATFDPAPGAASYNLYLDDCAVTGATGAPVNPAYDPVVEQTAPGTTGMQSGQTFVSLLPVDGTFQICVRSVDAQGQERADPGPVATVTVGPLGTIQNLNITIGCPNGPCTVTTVIN